MEDDDDILALGSVRQNPPVGSATQNVQRIASRVRGAPTAGIQSNQRNQAGRGSLGSSLGDSSGTGVNTQNQNRGFITIGQNSGPSLDRSPTAAANDAIKRLGLLQRRNRLSPGRAARLQNEAIGDLLQAETTRRGQDINQNVSAADRFSREIVSNADRQARLTETFAGLESQENRAAQDLAFRGSEGQADRGLRRELGELDLTSRALDRQQRAQEAEAQLAQGDRRLDLSEAEQRALNAFRGEQLGIDRERIDQSNRQFNTQEQRLLKSLGIDQNNAQARILLDLFDPTRTVPEESRAAIRDLIGLGQP